MSFGKPSIHWVYGSCILYYILGYPGISRDIPVYARKFHHYFESGMSSLAASSCLCCVLFLCIDHSLLPCFSLLDSQAPQPRLAASELPQPRINLRDIAAAPSVHSSSVSTSKREAWILALAVKLLNLWGIVRVKLPSRNNGITGLGRSKLLYCLFHALSASHHLVHWQLLVLRTWVRIPFLMRRPHVPRPPLLTDDLDPVSLHHVLLHETLQETGVSKVYTMLYFAIFWYDILGYPMSTGLSQSGLICMCAERTGRCPSCVGRAGRSRKNWSHVGPYLLCLGRLELSDGLGCCCISLRRSPGTQAFPATF